MKTLRVVLTSLVFAACCAATAAARQALPEPKLTPAPSTDRQEALIREGISLHDGGDLDGYVPYFVELKHKGHAEAFAYSALCGSSLPGVREWLEANSGRVMQFLIWSKGYKWPTDLKL
jgi:hypothetical protein